MEQPKVGYVYFVYAEGLFETDNLIKIGSTTDVENELKLLQIGNAYKLKVYKSIESVNYEAIEKYLCALCEYKKFREWFQLTRYEIDLLIKEISKPKQNLFSIDNYMEWFEMKWRSVPEVFIHIWCSPDMRYHTYMYLFSLDKKLTWETVISMEFKYFREVLCKDLPRMAKKLYLLERATHRIQ